MVSRDTALTFLNTVIEPALQAIGCWSPAAGVLLLGTAIQESRLCYRRQIGGGPGLGLWQMEPQTYGDCYDNYLRFRPELAAKIIAQGRRHEWPEPEWLITHDRFAAALARVKYLRAPAPLPDASDIRAMASYWKQWYNSLEGAGSALQFIDNWNVAMGTE